MILMMDMNSSSRVCQHLVRAYPARSKQLGVETHSHAAKVRRRRSSVAIWNMMSLCQNVNSHVSHANLSLKSCNIPRVPKATFKYCKRIKRTYNSLQMNSRLKVRCLASRLTAPEDLGNDREGERGRTRVKDNEQGP
jgi:hypothetical protein